MNRPHFLIIGAQKCGTTWLWDMLKQHPGTDLGMEKEIYYFSSAENYRKGREWYYGHFKGLDAAKIIGEASTDYFYDRPLLEHLFTDTSLPSIPELVKSELPDAKILLILRDPVQRYISAYLHHLQSRRFSPRTGLLEATEKLPIARMIERGYYARYLSLWKKYFPEDQMHCMVFEEDILRQPERSISEVYAFLGLDGAFNPPDLKMSKNKGWGWTHLLLNYYLGPWYGFLYRGLRKMKLDSWLTRLDIVKHPRFKSEDISTLREFYLPEKVELETMLNRKLNKWHYGISQ